MISELLKGGSVSSFFVHVYSIFVRQYVIDRVGIDKVVHSRILFSDKNQTSPMAFQFCTGRCAGIPTNQFTDEFMDPMAKKAVVPSSSCRMISWTIVSAFEFIMLNYQRWSKMDALIVRIAEKMIRKSRKYLESKLKRTFGNFRTVMITVSFIKYAHTKNKD
jgi:hypothetical protein